MVPQVVAFEVDGVTYVDGSLSMDLPFKRMATLFNVSNFIVSQVTFLSPTSFIAIVSFVHGSCTHSHTCLDYSWICLNTLSCFKINRAMVGCTLNDYFCCLPQVNFHVLPFVRKEHTSATSVFWKALRFLELDIRHRASRY
jgi:hypothetical protein